MSTQQECVELANGVQMPVIGYGTWQIPVNERFLSTIHTAIQLGYRHFDTAQIYQNADLLGEAVRFSGFPRKDFFLSCKIWATCRSYETAYEAVCETYDRMKVGAIDLICVHWPTTQGDPMLWQSANAGVWRALEDAQLEGKVRAIGVANFLPHHLVPLLARARIRPAVNQLEIHPGHTQFSTVNWCLKQGIQVQAWSPLGRGALLTNPTVLAIARAHNVAPAQVLLRWSIERQLCPIVKAVDLIHMRENLRLYHFELSDEEISALDKLPPSTAYSGLHPDTVTF